MFYDEIVYIDYVPKRKRDLNQRHAKNESKTLNLRWRHYMRRKRVLTSTTAYTESCHFNSCPTKIAFSRAFKDNI